MRWFHSHLKNLVFGIILFNPLYLALAEDIEIDLGGNSTSTSKSSIPADHQKVTVTKQKISSGGVTSEDRSPSTATLSHLASVVNRVSISTEGGETLVSIDGESLPRPLVQKISNQKILVKFPKTKLKIPSKINGNNEVIKNIRSSIHPGSTAWIVLDVVEVKKWDIQKSEAGYSLTLNSSEGLKRQTEINMKEIFSRENESSTEKKLFSRLIDASIKTVEKGIKIVLTSDGPSKYTVRKLSQPEKLLVRIHNTQLDTVAKMNKFKTGDSELQKGGIIMMELRQIGPSFSPISEAILTLMPG